MPTAKSVGISEKLWHKIMGIKWKEGFSSVEKLIDYAVDKTFKGGIKHGKDKST